MRPGAEIQRYVSHCAGKYGVTRHIRYRSRVVRSEFDGTRDTWTTHLEDGSVVTSRYLIAATGLFTQPILPDIAGLESFAGKTMHTARWDHGYDVTSKRVAIIGTGATAVQVVPEIAPLVTQLTVFQRTPIWIAPKLDRTLSGSRAARCDGSASISENIARSFPNRVSSSSLSRSSTTGDSRSWSGSCSGASAP